MFWVTSSIFWVLWRRFFECFWNFVEAFKLRFLGHSSIKSHGRNALYWKSNWLRKQREGISELFESCNIESASNFVFGFWKVSFHNWESVTVRCNGELPCMACSRSKREKTPCGKQVSLFHSHALFRNSPHCLPNTAYNFSLKSLVWNQMMIHRYFSIFSSLVYLRLYWYCKEKFCLGHYWGWKV